MMMYWCNLRMKTMFVVTCVRVCICLCIHITSNNRVKSYCGIRKLDLDSENDVLTSEGSGHGNFLDVLTDDEDSVNYKVTDYTDDYVDRPIEEIAVKCFNCLGGDSGCDVIAMQADVKMHSVWCLGKCLNISDGPVAIYQCAHDMTTQFEGCLENDGTKMCFCSDHFCNFPSQNLLDETALILPSEPSFILNSEDKFTNSIVDNIIGNNSASRKNKTLDNRLKDSKYLKETQSKTDNLSKHIDVSISVSVINKTMASKHNNRINRFPFVFKKETDVIIPRQIADTDEEHKNSIEDNSSTFSLNRPAVGNLRHGSDESCAPLLNNCIPLLISMFMSVLFICLDWVI